MTQTRETLAAFLLKKEYLSPEKLTEAIRQSAEHQVPFATALVKLEMLEPDRLRQILSEYYGMPFIDSRQSVDSAYFRLLPESVIRKYKAIPVKTQDKTLTVAMVEPDNRFSIEYIQMVSGYLIEPVGISEPEFNQVVGLYFAGADLDHLVKDLSIPEVTSLVEEVAEGNEEKPVAKLVDAVLVHAVKLSASDVHFEPQDRDILVRLRIDGALRTVEILPKALHNHVVSRVKVLGGMNITERRVPQDGQVRMKILDRDIDLRISTLPGRYGEKMVLRVLDKTSFLLGMEQLGMSPALQIKVEEVITQSSGMFLVTGPTGSGKTTTLYACLNRIRSAFNNIITLEDPIEYELLAGKAREGGITQVQINPKVGLTFVEGLKSILRQDPDVIFVGEIRDRESAEIAFTSALTGHFVLSSLHTIGAAQTVTRLLDIGVEPYLIISTLKGVASQRLVRVLCPHCKEPYQPPGRILEKLPLKSLPKAEGLTFYRPQGCPWCAKTGYRGRRAIFELMEMNDELRYLLLSKAPNTEILKCASRSGMMTLQQAGLEAVTQGITTVSEVLRVAPHE